MQNPYESSQPLTAESQAVERESWWSRPCGGREVLAIALPLVVSTMFWSIQWFVDRMFLMWHSSAEMTAALPAGMAHWTMICFPAGIASFVNTFVAQYHGEGKPERIGLAVAQGVRLGWICTPLFLLSIPLAPLLFGASADREVAKLESGVFPISGIWRRGHGAGKCPLRLLHRSRNDRRGNEGAGRRDAAQRGAGLHPHLRQVRLSRDGDQRSRHRHGSQQLVQRSGVHDSASMFPRTRQVRAQFRQPFRLRPLLAAPKVRASRWTAAAGGRSFVHATDALRDGDWQCGRLGDGPGVQRQLHRLHSDLRRQHRHLHARRSEAR